jgi:hypothetical protein
MYVETINLKLLRGKRLEMLPHFVEDILTVVAQIKCPLGQVIWSRGWLPWLQGCNCSVVQHKQSKAVPLHAMMALGGRGGIDPTHSWPALDGGVSGQRHTLAAI